MNEQVVPESLKREEGGGKRFRRSLLEAPAETTKIDYKAPNPFVEGGDFAISLVKDVLGMANDGGGYLVIGFKEDGAHRLTPGAPLTEEQLGAYETTRFAQYVQTFIHGSDRIELVIYKETFDGVTYPIIELFPFERRPFFCSKTIERNGKTVTRKGALYVRVPGAKTIEAGDPDAWERLIDIVVEQRREESIKSLRTVLEDFGVSSRTQTGEDIEAAIQKEISGWIDKNRDEVREVLKKNNFSQLAFFEVIHYPVGQILRREPKELLDVAEKSMLHNTGWPIGIVLHIDDGKPMPIGDGIKAIVAGHDSIDFWHLRNDGVYYFARSYQEDRVPRSSQYPPKAERPFLYFDTRIWRITEALQHCNALYRNLDVKSTTKIIIQINHYGIMGRELDTASPYRVMWSRKAMAEQSNWQAEITLDGLVASYKDFVKEISCQLFELFDFWRPENGVVESVIEEYEQSRIQMTRSIRKQ